MVRPELRHQPEQEAADRDVQHAALAHAFRKDDERAHRNSTVQTASDACVDAYTVLNEKMPTINAERVAVRCADQRLHEAIEQDRHGGVDDDLRRAAAPIRDRRTSQ